MFLNLPKILGEGAQAPPAPPPATGLNKMIKLQSIHYSKAVKSLKGLKEKDLLNVLC